MLGQLNYPALTEAGPLHQNTTAQPLRLDPLPGGNPPNQLNDPGHDQGTPGAGGAHPPTQAHGGQLNDPDQPRGARKSPYRARGAVGVGESRAREEGPGAALGRDQHKPVTGPAYHTYTRAAAYVYDRSTTADI